VTDNGSGTGESARRTFLKTAGVIAVGTVTVGSAAACAVKDPATPAPDDAETTRTLGMDQPLLEALAEAVLPASLGAAGRREATTTFVAWVNGYEPVAEEMHGYGYADVRYLPADPAPAWRAQLQALDTLARKATRTPFTQLPVARRQELLDAVLRTERGDRLPAPLGAGHVALALLAHWSASPTAWNLALGAEVTPASCRVLNDAIRKPLPLAPTGAAT
jgi:hypothetical protein